METYLNMSGHGLNTSGSLLHLKKIPSMVIPGGITGVTMSYLSSLYSLTYFSLGFLGGTYTLGKLTRSNASGVSSCIGVDVYLLRRFFIINVDSPTFGGFMALFTLIRPTTHSTLSFVRFGSSLALCSIEYAYNHNLFSFPLL